MNKRDKAVIKKQNNTEKFNAMDRESNITLVSTTVSIFSFLILLYAQNVVTTNFTKAQTFLTVIEFICSISAVALAVVAIVKRKSYLWEYVAFGLITALGYYLMLHGAAGIPFLVKESAHSITVSPLATKLSKILQTNYIIYALWGLNVLYCVLSIALHSVKYTKIKNRGSKRKADK